MLVAALERANDGGTAFGLHGKHLRSLRPDPANSLELGERFPHADQTGSAAGRVEDGLGQTPAELLGELYAHRLLTLDPVGLFQGGKIQPTGTSGRLAHDAPAVVDEPVHAPYLRALHRDLAHVDLRGIRGTQHAGVTVGGHGQVGKTQLPGHGHGQSEASCLERTGGQSALILDPDAAAGRAGNRDHGGDDFSQGDHVLRATHGQKLPVTPEAALAAGDVRLAHRSRKTRQVVSDEQRSPRSREAVDLIGRVVLPGKRALEMGNEGLQSGLGLGLGEPALAARLAGYFGRQL
jgi:hypothetical protein